MHGHKDIISRQWSCCMKHKNKKVNFKNTIYPKMKEMSGPHKCSKAFVMPSGDGLQLGMGIDEDLLSPIPLST